MSSWMGLVGAGLSNDEIAQRLVLSPATAKTHVSPIMTKLRVRDRAQLVILADESGMIPRGGWADRAPSPLPAPVTQLLGYADLLVGGSTSATEDFAATVPDRMPLFVAIVVGVSALLLVVFRSVLIPVEAALLNPISIGAALGVITLVFQHGWFGVGPGPIEAFIPVMIFAIVFGLSMDYEVFLLSRVQESGNAPGTRRRRCVRGSRRPAR